jgi:holo-ACP synthase / triphosphoribosyl-dephospho-CoA synthase
MTDAILAAKELRWEKKLSMAKALDARGQDRPAALAVLTLRMPAELRTSGEFSATALSMHAAFADELRARGIPILHEEFRVGDDGPESYIAAAIDPIRFKRMAEEWEKRHPLGDLADLDIMDTKGKPVGRSDLGLPPRTCLVCGEEAALCVTGRRHGFDAIEARIRKILRKSELAESEEDRRIGRLALTAALFEASATPKPGLVDPVSRGAHRDMDYSTFLSSAAAIGPRFVEFAKLGRLHEGEPSGLLPALRETGKAAERDMFDATGGVNTHKGLIFSLGLLCAAAGRLAAAGCELDPRGGVAVCGSEPPGGPDSRARAAGNGFDPRAGAAGNGFDPRACAAGAAAIVRGITLRDFNGGSAAAFAVDGAAAGGGLVSGDAADRGSVGAAAGGNSAANDTVIGAGDTVTDLSSTGKATVGERLYANEGVRGIRGEAEDGFPAVLDHALPRLRESLAVGLSWNDAMIDALLVLCAKVEDTNVLGRAGRDGLAFLRTEAERALGLGGMATEAGRAAARAMDASLTRRNISPGGCADLLALAVFLEKLART